ncbi:MAG: amino acid permease [Bacteroidota bacterium]
MKKLERRLSLASVVAISIGGMLGSGIFVLPGLAAAKTGPSVWLAYLIAGICVLPAALSKAELATAMPTSGGTYIYIERTFGPLMGTISGLGLWLSLLLKSSFALVGFGAYLRVLADIPIMYASLFFLALIILINITGVKKVGQVQLFIVSFSLIGLAILLGLGMIDFNPARLTPLFKKGTGGLITATAFVFVSYAGVTKVAAIAEEVRNPDKNLPIAMMLALGLVTAIYSLGALMLVAHIPLEDLSTDIRPIYTLADTIGGKTMGIIAAVLGVVTLSSMANSGVLAASRFPFAMGRDKLLPAFFQQINPKYLTPAKAIIVTGVIMAAVIVLLDVEKIAKLASAFKVTMFLTVNLCLIVLRETAVGWYKPRYRSPLYPWIQIFGVLTGIVLLAYLGSFAMFGLLLIICIGSLTYFGYSRKRVSRRGVLRVYGHRPAAYVLYRRSRSEQHESLIGITKDADLDGSLPEHANTVVPLFGKERSPEMLVEMAAALAPGGKTEVVHLQEVPDQTALDDMLTDEPVVVSLNRRIQAMAEIRKVDIEFDAAVTHDLVQTVQEISEQTHCSWLVAGWDGRSGNGLFVRNPIGWLVTHIDSNFALYKDNGVRYVRKILLALHPGQVNPAYLQVADRIAQFYQAELSLLRVLPAKATEQDVQDLLAADAPSLHLCKSNIHPRVLKGDDPAEVIAEQSAGYDLLIIGTARQENRLSMLLGTTKDIIADKAACSVLRLTIQ